LIPKSSVNFYPKVMLCTASKLNLTKLQTACETWHCCAPVCSSSQQCKIKEW